MIGISEFQNFGLQQNHNVQLQWILEAILQFVVKIEVPCA